MLTYLKFLASMFNLGYIAFQSSTVLLPHTSLSDYASSRRSWYSWRSRYIASCCRHYLEISALPPLSRPPLLLLEKLDTEFQTTSATGQSVTYDICYGLQLMQLYSQCFRRFRTWSSKRVTDLCRLFLSWWYVWNGNYAESWLQSTDAQSLPLFEHLDHFEVVMWSN